MSSFRGLVFKDTFCACGCSHFNSLFGTQIARDIYDLPKQNSYDIIINVEFNLLIQS